MQDSKELAILTGLLDFYSDRATAHASFVVAGVFGIYSVLFAGKSLDPMVLCLVYAALVIFDIYSFLNFGYYATLADIVKVKLANGHFQKYERELTKELKARSRYLYWFKMSRRGMKGKPKLLIFFLLWILAVLLPFIVLYVRLFFQVLLIIIVIGVVFIIEAIRGKKITSIQS